jgi:hypothetical protein
VPTKAELSSRKKAGTSSQELMTFQNWPSVTNWLPGLCNSIRMMTENRPPIRPAMIEKMI